MKPMTLIFIGSIIIVIGGIIGAIGTLTHNKNSSEKSSRIETGVINANLTVGDLIKQNNELLEKAEIQSRTIDKLRGENTSLYEKLTAASNEIYNNITGGKSLVRAIIGNIINDGDYADFIFVVEGKYPLRDITMSITDLNTFNTKVPKWTNYKILNIKPGEAIISKLTVKLDKIKGVNYNIQFNANNGHTIQLIRMRYVNNKWTSADKIRTTEEDKAIFLKVDKDYPIKNVSEIFSNKL